MMVRLSSSNTQSKITMTLSTAHRVSNRSFRRPEARARSRRAGPVPLFELLESRQLLSITVDTFDDVVNSGDSLTSLREAITQAAGSAEDTVVLPHEIGGVEGTYALALGEFLIADADGLTIESDGGSATIDARGASRVFEVAGGSALSLEGLAITGGHATDLGGAILNSGTLTIDASTLQGNTADAGGGAIFTFPLSSTVITNSTLSGNTAGQFGGAISNAAHLEITGSTISANSALASNGGGLDNVGDVTIGSTVFEGNTAGGMGGAFASRGVNGDHGTMTVDESSLLNNSAVGNGGGFDSSGILVLTDSLIDGNHADGWGGGLDNSGTLTVEDCTITANDAIINGGGIFNNFSDDTFASTMDITGTTFAGNTSSGYGGAISTWGTSTITGGSIENNTALYGGGAIDNYTGPLAISGTLIESNTAGAQGGGINNYFATLEITDCTFQGNAGSNGGGIYSGNGNETIDSSTFSANSATFEGGGLDLSGSIMTTITGSTFQNNNTAGYGGGVNSYYSTMSLVDTSVSGNIGSSGGGGLYSYGGNTTITNDSFDSNSSAYGAGGGLFTSYDSANITATNFLNNSANYGGGVAHYYGSATIAGSAFQGNTATYYGGGIYNSGTLTLSDSTVVANSAVVGYGGGFYNDYFAGGTISDNTFYSNSAAAGGGIYIYGVDFITISSNRVNQNQGSGITIQGFYAVVQSNTITNNIGDGVRIDGGYYNTIGIPGSGNVITGNTGAGVAVVNNGLANSIRGNVINANGGLAIDLGDDGRTPNDPGDSDEGLNELQNFPVITGVGTGATTHVTGRLNSTPSSTFTIDLYADSAAIPINPGESTRYLGAINVTTDASGDASFDVTLPAATSSNEIVTATATDPIGSTSEFSNFNLVQVTPTAGLFTTESGGKAKFSVVLALKPTANVTVKLSSSDKTEGTLSAASLTFTPANWKIPQVVTVTGVDDSIADGAIDYTIVTAPAISADPMYSGFDPDDVQVTNFDNEFTSVAAIQPLGSLIYSTSLAGGIAASGNVETYSLSVDPGQTITVVVHPAGAGLKPAIQLLQGGSAVLGTATAGAAGQDAVVQTVATPGQLWAGGPGAKTYQIRVTGASGTTGEYSIQVILNSAVENESHSGAANDTRAKAQSLEPSFLSLTAASSCSSVSSDAGRAAVLGHADVATADYYSFALAAGGTATLALVGLSGQAPALALEDSTGTTLAIGRTDATNVGQVINTFVAAKAGTYYVRITGADPAGTDYSLVVTRNAEFDTEGNDTTSTAQDLISPEVSAQRWVMGSIDSALGSPTDFYRITAAGNDTIEIATETPASKSGQFANGFDPALRLYDQAGNLVASNDNGAADGRNAKISFKMPKTKGGTYLIQVVASSTTPVPTSGEYVLAVKAATGALSAFNVTATDIPDNSAFRYPPTSIQLDFNDVVLLTSLQASDLKVDGKAVSGFTVIDGNTVVFALPSTLADGTHTVTIASGAITDVQKTPIAAFTTHFSTDQTSPRVVSSSIQQNGIVTPGSLTYTVKFSEPMQTAYLDSFDFALTGAFKGASYTPTSFGFDASGKTLTIQYAGLPEDNYALTLFSGDFAFEDVVGNNLDGEALAWPIPTHVSGDGVEGGNFEVDFAMDVGTAAFPTPLTAEPPLGSLIYASSALGAINFAGDTDRYTLSLDAGQTMTVSVSPGSPAFGANPLAPTVELRDPSNNVIATASAAGGIEAILQTVPTSMAGTYTITLGGAAGTTGLFTATVTLNAAVELESHGGPSNDSPGAAQDIDGSFIGLLKGASRGAVLGGTGNNDVYSLTLQAGQTLTADLVFHGAAPAQIFGASSDYDEYAPSSVALGDVNNDGHLDMVDSSQNGWYLTVRLGNGDGSFGAPSSFGSGSYQPQQIAIADLNGDGDLDVIAANSLGGVYGTGSVTVMLGHGDGTFDPAVGYFAGTNNSALAIGDVDGDGTPDIVTTSMDDSAVHVLRNNGDGTFGPDVSYVVGNGPRGVALGDFNGDGALDIVTTSFYDYSGNQVTVLTNHGDGTFDPGVHYFGGNYAYGVAVGDVNADGALDILATNYYDDTVAVLDNNGDGTFASPTFLYAAGYYPAAVALGDLNGDGALDVVVGSNYNSTFSGGNVSTLLNDGSGSFGPASATDAGYYTNSVALGDIDGDGRLDLATANVNGSSLSVFLNQSKPETLELIAPDGVTVLASATVGNNDQAAFSNFVAAESGTYYLQISGPPIIQSYSLVATRDAVFDLGGNDTLELAQPLGPVHVALGYVSASDDVSDFYSFDATAGQTIDLFTTTPADGPGEFGNTLNPRLVVHGPDGSTMFGTPLLDGRNEEIVFSATVGGTYIVEVSAEARTSGEYILDPSPVLTGLNALASQGAASAMPAFALAPVITPMGGEIAAALQRSGLLGTMSPYVSLSPSGVSPVSQAGRSIATSASGPPREAEGVSPVLDRSGSRAGSGSPQRALVASVSPASPVVRVETSLSRTADGRDDLELREWPGDFLDDDFLDDLCPAWTANPSFVVSEAGAVGFTGQRGAEFADGHGAFESSDRSAITSRDLALASAAVLAAFDRALSHLGERAARLRIIRLGRN
jgi:hypothetical protein